MQGFYLKAILLNSFIKAYRVEKPFILLNWPTEGEIWRFKNVLNSGVN